MFSKLEKLTNMGYYPDTILDIGAHHGIWTKNMMSIYPNSKYYYSKGLIIQNSTRLLIIKMYFFIMYY